MSGGLGLRTPSWLDFTVVLEASSPLHLLAEALDRELLPAWPNLSSKDEAELESLAEELGISAETRAEWFGLASSQTEASPPALGCVEGFEILEELARGSMGVVYRAREVGLGREVALKQVLGNLDRSRRERFRREALALARVHHPNVVQVHNVYEGSPATLVMELVTGESLADVLKRTGRFEPRRALEVALDVARALKAAHEVGVLHRDVKPHNAILTPAGHVKLVDFGLALLEEEGSVDWRTATGLLLGTPAYMAPEQAGQGEVDARADVYAVGALLFESLTGRLPFAAATLVETLVAVASQPAPAPSAFAPGVGPALDAIVARCLAKDPDDRYPSAAALVEALEAALRGPLLSRSPASSRVTLAVCVGLGVAAVAAGVVARPSPPLASVSSQATAQPLPSSPQRAAWNRLLARFLAGAPPSELRASRAGLDPELGRDVLAAREGPLLVHARKEIDAERALLLLERLEALDLAEAPSVRRAAQSVLATLVSRWESSRAASASLDWKGSPGSKLAAAQERALRLGLGLDPRVEAILKAEYRRTSTSSPDLTLDVLHLGVNVRHGFAHGIIAKRLFPFDQSTLSERGTQAEAYLLMAQALPEKAELVELRGSARTRCEQLVREVINSPRANLAPLYKGEVLLLRALLRPEDPLPEGIEDLVASDPILLRELASARVLRRPAEAATIWSGLVTRLRATFPPTDEGAQRTAQEALLPLGDALAREGRKEEARRVWREGLEATRGTPRAKLFATRLERAR